MQRMNALVLAGVLCTGAGPVLANPGVPYIGLDAFLWELDVDDVPEAEATGLRVRGGVEINPYLAFEVHLASGGSDRVRISEPGFGSFDVDIELDYLAGAFLRGQIPLSERFRLYGLAGYSKAKFTMKGLGGSVSDDDTGLSLGLGGQFLATEQVFLSADYVLYLNKSDYDFGALSLGAGYRF